MARMIPTSFDDSTPPGERKAFDWLRRNSPNDWVVLHSLDLAPWNKGRKTEIDFLVLLPHFGILVIEVKSHERITYEEDGWRLNGISDPRGPFKQVDDALATLARRIKEQLPNCSRIPLCRAVMFPCAVFRAQDNASYRAYEVFDLIRCEEAMTHGTFAQELEQVVVEGIGANRILSQLPPAGIESELLASLLSFLRPVQTITETAKQERIARRAQLEHVLVEQQKPVLNAADSNPRVIVKGGAGTGKTHIGLEIARRSVEEGYRTGLFCFNRFVGEWMDSSLRPRGPGLVAGPFLQRLAVMFDIGVAEALDADRLAAHIAEAMAHFPTAEQVLFDRVIIDEAQDILCHLGLRKCLDLILKNGLAGGNWVLLGDFDHQVLDSPAARKRMEAVLNDNDALGHPTRWRLTENCRNFKRIAQTAAEMAGIREQLYEGYRRGNGDMTSDRVHIYGSNTEQLQILRAEIEYWRSRNVQDKDIVILSAKASVDGVANRLDASIPRRQIGDPGYSLACGTVGDFKGLESEVVILTDIDIGVGGSPEHRRDLFYTGITRATLGVSLLMTPEASSLITAGDLA